MTLIHYKYKYSIVKTCYRFQVHFSSADNLYCIGMDSWSRKIVGALKDAGNIGYAKLNSKAADIDIAVLKCSRHNDIPPEEKHVLTALAATESSELLPHLRRVVRMRLSRTKNWMVTLKTLALIHRLLRDGRGQIPIFTDEDKPQYSSNKDLLASMSEHFKDGSSPLAIECSGWIRKYSSYLTRRLHCNRILKYGADNNQKDIMEVKELLEDMKSLEMLVDCLVDCNIPDEFPVAKNSLFQYVLHLLMKECSNICAAFNVCICNLLDEMPREKTQYLVDVYKRILQQREEKVSDFYHRSYSLLVANADNAFPESFSTQNKDYLQKYRDCPNSEMEDMGLQKYRDCPNSEMEDMGLSSVYLEAEEDDVAKKEESVVETHLDTADASTTAATEETSAIN